MIRVCLDTNILISGLISSKGAPHEILSALRKREFLLISSLEIIDEIKRVLNYPSIKKNYNLTPDQIKRLTKLVRKYSYKCRSASNLKVIKDDPDDNKFLHVAIQGKADFIVFGDKHLLDLRTFQGIPIITARQFIYIFNQRNK